MTGMVKNEVVKVDVIKREPCPGGATG